MDLQNRFAEEERRDITNRMADRQDKAGSMTVDRKNSICALALFLMLITLGNNLCLGEETQEHLPLMKGESLIEPLSESPEHVKMLLDVARGELGYTESKNGRTKYGEWVGDPTCQWCAEFLCWCVDQVDQKSGTQLLEKIYPLYGAQNVGRNWFIREGRYIARIGFVPDWGSQWYRGENELMQKNSYIPQPGDWVFFANTDTGDTYHVAMVEFCGKDTENKVYVHVLEGNMPDKVQRNVYLLTDEHIQGYGTVYDLADWSMHPGNRGEKVRQLQQDLCSLGYMEERFMTGTYGDITRNAVIAFQRDHGIDQTGNAGPLTQRALSSLIEEKFGMDEWDVD